MKKILAILFLTFALALIGCEVDNSSDGKNYTCDDAYIHLMDIRAGYLYLEHLDNNCPDNLTQDQINCIAEIKDKSEYEDCLK